MRGLLLAAVTCITILIGAAAASADVDTQVLTINATVNSQAKLTLSSTTVNFASANPDTTPSIPADENPVSVTAKARTGSASTVTLTVLAAGDLLSGGDTIAINNVSWTASGAGFVGGIMDKTIAQSAGSWTGSGNRSGAFSYFLANSWDYPTGSYMQSATYTLTAP